MIESELLRQERIAVVGGGSSSEASIARRSAINVTTALRERFTEVDVFELDSKLASQLSAFAPDVVFPVTHGARGEDGCLQGFLDVMGYRYVGSGVEASAICMNKALTNRLYRAMPKPRGIESTHWAPPPRIDVRRGDNVRNVVEPLFNDGMRYTRCIIKPARGGSSLGISICPNRNLAPIEDETRSCTSLAQIHEARLTHLVHVVEQTLKSDSLVLVQRAVPGIELTVGVVEDLPHVKRDQNALPNHEATSLTQVGAAALPVIEIATPVGTWFDYDSKSVASG